MQDERQITTDTEVLWSEEWMKNAQPHHDIIAAYLKDKLKGHILDIGEYNPLTLRLMTENGVQIDNTKGDLDNELILPHAWKYETIICSHVIEHLFNPLDFLNNVKKIMAGRLYIVAPIKPYWITPARCHFHEMDFERFKMLTDKAGLHIIGWYTYSVPVAFKLSVRNWLRRLYKEFAIITLVK